MVERTYITLFSLDDFPPSKQAGQHQHPTAMQIYDVIDFLAQATKVTDDAVFISFSTNTTVYSTVISFFP